MAASRGRPRQPGQTTVQFRVHESERAAYETRAKELGLTVSEWIRMLARRDSGLWMADAATPAPKPPS